jgi:hypothetical protein
MMPVTTGVSSPEVAAASIASSMSFRPRASLTLAQQRAPLQVAREGDEIDVAEAFTDLRSACTGVERLGRLARVGDGRWPCGTSR